MRAVSCVSTHSHSNSHILFLSQSLTLSHSFSLTFNKGNVKELSDKILLRARATVSWNLDIALALEHVRTGRGLWLAQRCKHHSRIASLEHDAEPTAPSCEAGCRRPRAAIPPLGCPFIWPVVPIRRLRSVPSDPGFRMLGGRVSPCISGFRHLPVREAFGELRPRQQLPTRLRGCVSSSSPPLPEAPSILLRRLCNRRRRSAYSRLAVTPLPDV